MDPVVDVTLRGALALLLLGAAVHKLHDLHAFRRVLHAYGLVPEPLLPATATAVALVESCVAALLCTPALRTTGLAAAAGLLVVYAAAIALALARGRRHIDCGCSRTPQELSAWLVGRNVALALLALAALLPVRPRALVWVDALTIAAAVTALALLYAAADRLLATLPAAARLRGAA
jgi:hypothetical protein